MRAMTYPTTAENDPLQETDAVEEPRLDADREKAEADAAAAASVLSEDPNDGFELIGEGLEKLAVETPEPRSLDPVDEGASTPPLNAGSNPADEATRRLDEMERVRQYFEEARTRQRLIDRGVEVSGPLKDGGWYRIRDDMFTVGGKDGGAVCLARAARFHTNSVSKYVMFHDPDGAKVGWVNAELTDQAYEDISAAVGRQIRLRKEREATEKCRRDGNDGDRAGEVSGPLPDGGRYSIRGDVFTASGKEGCGSVCLADATRFSNADGYVSVRDSKGIEIGSAFVQLSTEACFHLSEAIQRQVRLRAERETAKRPPTDDAERMAVVRNGGEVSGPLPNGGWYSIRGDMFTASGKKEGKTKTGGSACLVGAKSIRIDSSCGVVNFLDDNDRYISWVEVELSDQALKDLSEAVQRQIRLRAEKEANDPRPKETASKSEKRKRGAEDRGGDDDTGDVCFPAFRDGNEVALMNLTGRLLRLEIDDPRDSHSFDLGCVVSLRQVAKPTPTFFLETSTGMESWNFCLDVGAWEILNKRWNRVLREGAPVKRSKRG